MQHKQFSILILAAVILAFTHVAQALPAEGGAPRIVGGVDADRNAWPFITALVPKGADATRQFCGGSLIASQYVLTAAHCVETATPESIDVIVNIHDLRNEGSEGQRSAVAAIYPHEEYNAYTSSNDVAILKLSQPIDASKGTPVALASQSDIVSLEPGSNATTIGWGNTVAQPDPDDGYNFPNILRQVGVEYVSRTTCQNIGGGYSSITENAICAGFAEGGKDACQGDSGGPLIINDNGKIKLIGVVSWGDGCAQPNAYGVYANVGHFSGASGWIATKKLDIDYPTYTNARFISTNDRSRVVTISNNSDTSFNVIDAKAQSATISQNNCQSTLTQNTSCSIIMRCQTPSEKPLLC
ncbi:formyltetrahydrofolate deformylase [Veronia nyctiphanis]|uniref:Formyltetrahydrofolate deformylase n=1 Tax=Veronia nyctiphanis TaxID=1278244 RepID=A0A4Q0YLV5_9GAMM|nr:serine protease [Veronia nyctiphanis]RXJ71797.1 formyltetrahydrofolate deformylase [Veronia nyctiphanis]